MDKAKRIAALVGAIILGAMYILTLVLAITDNPATMNLFKASIVATAVVAVLIWAFTMVTKLLKDRRKEKDEEIERQSHLREQMKIHHDENNDDEN